MQKELVLQENQPKSTLFWDLYARTSENTSKLIPYRQLLWDSLQALNLKSGMRLLIVGCGMGAFEHFLAEKGITNIKVVSVESSPSRYRLAQKNLECLSFVKVIKANLETLPFKNESFDAIVSINVPAFVKQPAVLLDELQRVLKKNGKIVITKPKNDISNLSITLNHLNRIKNAKGATKRASHLTNSLKASALAGINPVLFRITNNDYVKVNKLDEKDVVKFSIDNDFKGLDIFPSYAKQGFVASIKPYVKEKINYPINYRIATHPKELEDIYKLRFKVYCQERNYMDPPQDSLGLEQDKYDKHSINFIALDENNQIIATSRIIHPSDQGLPITDYFNMSIDKDKSVEISRFIVKKNGRMYSHKMALGLIKLAYDYSIANDISYWYAVLDDFLLNYYQKKMKLVFHQLGEKKQCLGGNTAPYLFSLDEAAKILRHSDKKTYSFFTEPFYGYHGATSEQPIIQ